MQVMRFNTGILWPEIQVTVFQNLWVFTENAKNLQGMIRENLLVPKYLFVWEITNRETTI